MLESSAESYIQPLGQQTTRARIQFTDDPLFLGSSLELSLHSRKPSKSQVSPEYQIVYKVTRRQGNTQEATVEDKIKICSVEHKEG